MAQEWSLTGQAAEPPKLKGKGALVTGTVLLLVGILMGVGGIIGVVSSASSLVSAFGSPETTPTTITRTLDGGTTFVIYELATSGSGTSSDPFDYSVALEDITVTGPGGAVDVDDPGLTSDTYTSNGDSFVGVAEFDVPTTGSYEVVITTEGATVVLAPAFSAFGKSLAWLALVGLGALLGLIGIILLIVGAIRRSSSRKAQTGYGQQGYPAAGYPPAGYQQQAVGYPTDAGDRCARRRADAGACPGRAGPRRAARGRAAAGRVVRRPRASRRPALLGRHGLDRAHRLTSMARDGSGRGGITW